MNNTEGIKAVMELVKQLSIMYLKDQMNVTCRHVVCDRKLWGGNP